MMMTVSTSTQQVRSARTDTPDAIAGKLREQGQAEKARGEALKAEGGAQKAQGQATLAAGTDQVTLGQGQV